MAPLESSARHSSLRAADSRLFGTRITKLTEF